MLCFKPPLGVLIPDIYIYVEFKIHYQQNHFKNGCLPYQQALQVFLQ